VKIHELHWKWGNKGVTRESGVRNRVEDGDRWRNPGERRMVFPHTHFGQRRTYFSNTVLHEQEIALEFHGYFGEEWKLPYAQSIKLLHCIALPGLTKLRSPG
jgi:hypothetical protein